MSHQNQGVMPKTLLEWAAVPAQSVVWSEAVILLIDFQQEYVTGRLSLGEAGALAITAAGRLVALARAAGVPVVHIVHHGQPGSPLFDPGHEAVAIIPALAPLDGEQMIVKTLPNAFAGTPLAEDIRAMGRRQLVVAGFMSHMCVSSTVRAALDLGFPCVVCADACATRPLPGISGVVSARAMHEAEMAALGDRFATLTTVADLEAQTS